MTFKRRTALAKLKRLAEGGDVVTRDHPLVATAGSFATGIMAGLLFVCSSDPAGLTIVTSLVDRAVDGVGFFDAAIIAWFAGNLATLAHQVAPAIAWR